MSHSDSNSNNSSSKPLRQLAAEKAQGKGANPSQLGDPVSLKAETSDTTALPETKDDAMPTKTRTPPPSSGGSHEEKKLRSGHHVRGMMTDEIRKGEVGWPGKAVEGDATSLEREERVGEGKKGSRL